MKKHKDYYKAQQQANEKLTIGKMLIVLLVASMYFLFWYYGVAIYSQTIVGQKEIFALSFTSATVVFAALYFVVDKWKQEMSIITNLIIYYAHAMLFFGFALVITNYWSIGDDFVRTKLFVKEWNLNKERRTSTSAEVMYNGRVSSLRFQGDVIQEAEQVDSLLVEINTGILGYGYVKS
ncbi:MAG: hypothetical protein AAFV25_23870, partial [Bacteroidota bacterium]